MKNFRFATVLLSLLATSPACADFYQWTDSGGVVHMTDDPNNIPKAYKAKARRSQEGRSARPAADAAPAPQLSPEGSAPKPLTPGGYGEKWWRGRIQGLRGELTTLRDSRAKKELKLLELRRERTIFQRPRDREAINVLQAEVAADDARISETLNKIAALELAAAKEGVPSEWLH